MLQIFKNFRTKFDKYIFQPYYARMFLDCLIFNLCRNST